MIDIPEIKAAGIEEYLVKPVKHSRLFDCVAEIMHRRHSATALPEPAPGTPSTPTPAPAPAHAERVLLAEDNLDQPKGCPPAACQDCSPADAVADGNGSSRRWSKHPYKYHP